MIQFISDFFDANPLSHCSIVLTKDRTATVLSDMSANAKYHINKIRGVLAVKEPGGASLQNSLLMASRLLKHVPKYCTREVVVLYNSISTSDPGNIYSTVDTLKALDIKANILCLAAEVFVCKTVCEMTQGSFNVVLNSAHLVECLQYFSTPPVILSDDTISAAKDSTSFILMGFPVRKLSRSHLFSFDSTSFDSEAPVADSNSSGASSIMSANRHIKMCSVGYICPRCHVRMTDIPSECHVCGLRLISSAHIARSHHHLYPLENNEEVIPQSDAAVNIFANVKIVQEPVFMDSSEEEDQPQAEDDDEEYQEKARKRVKIADGSAVDVPVVSDKSIDELKDVKPPMGGDSTGTDPEASVVAVETKTSVETKPVVADTSASAASAAEPELDPKSKSKLKPTVPDVPESDAFCYGCLQRFGETPGMVSKSRCRACEHVYCLDCDLFIHDSLHNCPGDPR